MPAKPALRTEVLAVMPDDGELYDSDERCEAVTGYGTQCKMLATHLVCLRALLCWQHTRAARHSGSVKVVYSVPRARSQAGRTIGDAGDQRCG